MIDGLSNPKNVEVLLRAFLTSPFWQNGEAIDIAYAVTDAARYLSATRATAQASICKGVIKSSPGGPWRKTILLAALIAAESRDFDEPPSFLSSIGSLAPTFVQNLNDAAANVTDSPNDKAGLLIATSWVLTSLTPYQKTHIKSQTNRALFEGLYLSQLAFTAEGKTDLQPRGLKELGLMTRVLVDLYHRETDLAVLLSSVKVLAAMCEQQANNLEEHDRFAKSVFLSTIALLQAIFTAALRLQPNGTQRTVLAKCSLDILNRLQNVNPDNSVYESWQFIFNASLDMLDATGSELSSYLDSVLKFSPLALNPLSSSENKEIFSKRRDNNEVKWLLTVLEASAATVKNRGTLQRIFTFCFEKLKHDRTVTKEETELLHSVIISVVTSHEEEFKGVIRPYAQHLLESMENVTDRQFIILFKTLYRASLTTRPKTESADPQGLLYLLKNKLGTSDDPRVRKLCGTTLLELLPIVPSRHLETFLEWADENIIHVQDLSDLETRFIEICQTEMDSARALVCVKYLLARSHRGNTIAIQAKL